MNVQNEVDGCKPDLLDAASESIEIKIASSDHTRRTIAGTFKRLTSGWLLLDASEWIAPCMVVSVERADVFLLGEVVVCEKLPNSVWRTKIRVKHTLTGLEGLLRLRQALLGNPAAYSPNPVTVGHRCDA